MFKKIQLCVILLVAFFQSGCATHIPLSKVNARSINKIYVEPTIKKPKSMFVNTRASNAGFALGGIIGATIVANAQKNDVNTLQSMIDKKQVQVDAMIYQQWVNQLNKKSDFKVSKEKSDVVLETEISSYGISPAGSFSSDYASNLTLTAKLVRNNIIIWQDRKIVLALVDDLPKYKFDDVVKDPRKFSIMLNKAAEIAVDSLIADMKKQA